MPGDKGPVGEGHRAPGKEEAKPKHVIRIAGSHLAALLISPCATLASLLASRELLFMRRPQAARKTQ